MRIGCGTYCLRRWTVYVSGADRLKAHGSSDVCSELTQATHAQKGTQADKFTMASA
jgi:hypothetical protein